MAKTLDDALKAVVDIVGRVEGIRSAPEYATDKVPPGVFAIAYPAGGEWMEEVSGVLKGMHNIGLYVFCPRVDLPKTLKKIIPMGEKVAAALLKEPRLLDTCNTYGTISYDFVMSMNVGSPSAPAIVTGWQFVINDVKIEDVTSLA